jgi:hypothetical protein
MPNWRIIAGPREYEPTGSDCPVGWAWDIGAGVERRTVKVEISAIAMVMVASGERLPSADADMARRTRGRSAVEPYLDEDEPPLRLVISTGGVEPDAR